MDIGHTQAVAGANREFQFIDASAEQFRDALVFFVLAFTGYATMWMAVFADVGTSLIVSGNAVRALRK